MVFKFFTAQRLLLAARMDSAISGLANVLRNLRIIWTSEFLTAVATVAIAVATYLQFSELKDGGDIANRQLEEIRRLNEQTGKQISALKESVDVATRQAVASENANKIALEAIDRMNQQIRILERQVRPVISINDIEFRSDFIIDSKTDDGHSAAAVGLIVTLQNVGHATAEYVRTSAFLFPFDPHIDAGDKTKAQCNALISEREKKGKALWPEQKIKLYPPAFMSKKDLYEWQRLLDSIHDKKEDDKYPVMLGGCVMYEFNGNFYKTLFVRELDRDSVNGNEFDRISPYQMSLKKELLQMLQHQDIVEYSD